MAANSAIEWTDATFNPWRGCTKVSEACRRCYAETWAARNPAVFGQWGPMGTRVVAAEATWKEPGKWNKAAACGYCLACNGRGTKGDKECRTCAGTGELSHGRAFARVFCASLADIFEEWSGAMVDSTTVQLWYADPWWTTKPGGRVLDMKRVRDRAFTVFNSTPNLRWLLLTKRVENVVRMAPPFGPNVWIGATVEDRENLWRIDELKKVNCAKRFLSVEPLLEDLGPLDLKGIDWVIVGGESGTDARPMNPAWARSIRDQCEKAGVAFFFKQWGETLISDDALNFEQGEAWAKEFAGLKYEQHSSGHTVVHVGQRDVGRLLDGVEWSQFPA